MEELIKKLTQMKELTAQVAQNLESLSRPKINPTPNSDVVKPSKPIKPTTQGQKKDPKKMAEQLKNPDSKKIAMDNIKSGANLLKFNENGQWSLTKVEDEDQV